MVVLVRSEASTVDGLDDRRAISVERGIEVEVLRQAVTALHRDGILTDAEYETKRRRLSAQG